MRSCARRWGKRARVMAMKAFGTTCVAMIVAALWLAPGASASSGVIPRSRSSADPPGSFAAVSCASSAACVGVGSYINTAGNQRPLAEAWDGSTWSIQPIPSPVGATDGRALNGVSWPLGTSTTRPATAARWSSGRMGSLMRDRHDVHRGGILGTGREQHAWARGALERRPLVGSVHAATERRAGRCSERGFVHRANQFMAVGKLRCGDGGRGLGRVELDASEHSNP